MNGDRWEWKRGLQTEGGAQKDREHSPTETKKSQSVKGVVKVSNDKIKYNERIQWIWEMRRYPDLC